MIILQDPTRKWLILQNLLEKDYLLNSAIRMAILLDCGRKMIIVQDSDKMKEFVSFELHFNWLIISNLLKLVNQEIISCAVALLI